MNHDLASARRTLKEHMANKPVITGLCGFNVQDHIYSVDCWIADKKELEDKVLALESLQEPDAQDKRNSYERRKRLWQMKHYLEV